MSEYKELNIEELQEIEVRQGKHQPWERRRLIKIMDDGRALCIASNLFGSYKWMYYREIKEPTKREMTPFEAKVWCDEWNYQMVAKVNETLVMDISIWDDDSVENFRFISNAKIKELKGKITWEDCSEFPMIEEGEE